MSHYTACPNAKTRSSNYRPNMNPPNGKVGNPDFIASTLLCGYNLVRDFLVPLSRFSLLSCFSLGSRLSPLSRFSGLSRVLRLYSDAAGGGGTGTAGSGLRVAYVSLGAAPGGGTIFVLSSARMLSRFISGAATSTPSSPEPIRGSGFRV